MAIPRKGSRRLVVGHTSYRWNVTPDDEPGVGVVVELEDSPRQRLVGWVEHGVVVSPGRVRVMVEDALTQGWNPSNPGPDYRLEFYQRWKKEF